MLKFTSQFMELANIFSGLFIPDSERQMWYDLLIVDPSFESMDFSI